MAVSAIDKVPVLTGLQERVQDNAGDTSITPGAVLLDRNDQRTATVAQTPVTLSGPPANLTAAADTVLTWNTTSGEAYSVRRIEVQNKSGRNSVAAVDIFVEADAAASPGSIVVPPGGSYLSRDIPCNVLHIYCSAALALNGTADGNVVVKGWL
jgi:hypothetical protein